VRHIAWSAALRFAPRKNVNAQANKNRRPPASALISAGFSVAPASEEEQQQSASPVARSDQSPPTAAIASSSKAWTSIAKTETLPPKDDMKTDALHLKNRHHNSANSLPQIIAPPEFSISAEELEKDRALFADLAEKRGERKSAVHEWDHDDWQEDDDEDVNGFGNTKEGRKAKKKVSFRIALYGRTFSHEMFCRSTRERETLLQLTQAKWLPHCVWTPITMCESRMITTSSKIWCVAEGRMSRRLQKHEKQRKL
jgi:hypothetical protein